MKQRHIVAAIGMLSVGLVAFAIGRWQSQVTKAVLGEAGPAIGFSPAKIELGTVFWHTKIPFSVVFRNRSDAGLKVAAVKASCGCTGIDAGLYAGKQVLSGEEMRITGELDVGSGLGQRERDIELMLSDGTVYTASISYTARSTHTFAPDTVKFGALNLDVDEGNEGIARIAFQSESARIVGAPVCDSPWIEVSVAEQGGGKTELLLHANRQYMAPGRNMARVLVHTDGPYNPVFPLFASAGGISAVESIPAVIFLREGGERRVTFSTRDAKQPFRAVSASSDKSGVVATILDNGVSLQLRADQRVESDFSTVRVTDDAGRLARVQVRMIR